MNIRQTLVIILVSAATVLATLGLFVESAMAKTVSLQSQKQVKAGCDGVFWVPGKTGHTWGCLNNDGSGIVCSGVTANQKKTCSTFRTAPSNFHIPTREEFDKVAARAEKQ